MHFSFFYFLLIIIYPGEVLVKFKIEKESEKNHISLPVLLLPTVSDCDGGVQSNIL